MPISPGQPIKNMSIAVRTLTKAKAIVHHFEIPDVLVCSCNQKLKLLIPSFNTSAFKFFSVISFFNSLISVSRNCFSLLVL